MHFGISRREQRLDAVSQPRREAIVPRHVEKRAVVDDKAVRVLTDSSCGRRESAVVRRRWLRARAIWAAQDRLNVLVHDEAAQSSATGQAPWGEPDDALRASSSVNSLDLKAGKIDPDLLARRGLEPHLEWRDRIRPTPRTARSRPCGPRRNPAHVAPAGTERP
jgi:hypothetical protein